MTSLLEIDLKTKNIQKKNIEALRKNYIGALGINTKLLYDLVSHKDDPLSPGNVVIFGAGSLVGSKLPTACRTEVTAKSPLSGLFGTANAGSKWGYNLRRAGIDHVLIKEKSKAPVYLVIDNETVYLKDAKNIWSLDTYEATDKLKNKHGKEFSVAIIGPAGENQIRYASIQNDYHASWGRTGMGAVMGSKNLKAVIVRGDYKLESNNPETLKDLKKEAINRIKKEPTFGPTRKYGSMITSDPFNDIGALPGYNFDSGSIEDWDTHLGRKTYDTKYKEKDLACHSCPVACAHWSKIQGEGNHKDYETKGMEITFAMEFGAKLGLKEIPEILKCVELCDRYGMDVVSSAGSVAYFITSFKAGYYKNANIDFTPEWGDYDSIWNLLNMIGKREGIGDLLAEGVKRACQKYPETEKFAYHVKGVELPGRDPRAKMDVWSLGYLTSTRGGDHLRARSPVENLKKGLIDYKTEELGVTREHIENELDMPKKLKDEIFGVPPTGVNIPAMTVYAENLITIINSVGLCIRPPILRSLGPDFYARAMNAFYGEDFTEDTIYQAADTIYKLQFEFNNREGSKPSETKDYVFPSRFYNESLKTYNSSHSPLEHSPLDKPKVQNILEEYFKYRSIL